MIKKETILFTLIVCFALISLFYFSKIFTKQVSADGCDGFCGNGVCEQHCGENPTNCCVDCYTEHFEKKCYNGDVWWYDCFGDRTDKAEECRGETPLNSYRCNGNKVERKWKIKNGCSSGQCKITYEWRFYKDCTQEGKICQNGQCVPTTPSVDIKANGSDGPVEVNYQDWVQLTWTSQNVSSCQASGDWSGSKSTSGQESLQLNTVKTYTFIIECEAQDGSGTVNDSVQIKVNPLPPTVITKPTVSTR